VTLGQGGEAGAREKKCMETAGKGGMTFQSLGKRAIYWNAEPKIHLVGRGANWRERRERRKSIRGGFSGGGGEIKRKKGEKSPRHARRSGTDIEATPQKVSDEQKTEELAVNQKNVNPVIG